MSKATTDTITPATPLHPQHVPTSEASPPAADPAGGTVSAAADVSAVVSTDVSVEATAAPVAAADEGDDAADEAADEAPTSVSAEAPGTSQGGFASLPSTSSIADTTIRIWGKVQRLLPVASLLFSIVSAFLMERTPARAPLILGIAVVGWGLVAVALVVVQRLERRAAAADKEPSRWHKVGQFVAILVSQSMMQQALVFPLPFFVAAAWPPLLIHMPFALIYTLVLVIAAWDPFYEQAARFPPVLLFLQAFAGLVAGATVLPVLGFHNTAAVVATGVLVGLGVPLGFWVLGVPARWARRHGEKAGTRVWQISWGLGVAAVVAVVVGAPLLPPAPLALSSGTMATGVSDREPVGGAETFSSTTSSLWCHTAIRAPLGLKDTLRHVWTLDGRFIQEVKLTVSGGRETGFRTWSRLSRIRPGRYRCRVETTLGQVVGDVVADVSAGSAE